MGVDQDGKLAIEKSQPPKEGGEYQLCQALCPKRRQAEAAFLLSQVLQSPVWGSGGLGTLPVWSVCAISSGSHRPWVRGMPPSPGQAVWASGGC